MDTSGRVWFGGLHGANRVCPGCGAKAIWNLGNPGGAMRGVAMHSFESGLVRTQRQPARNGSSPACTSTRSATRKSARGERRMRAWPAERIRPHDPARDECDDHVTTKGLRACVLHVSQCRGGEGSPGRPRARYASQAASMNQCVASGSTLPRSSDNASASAFPCTGLHQQAHNGHSLSSGPLGSH